MKFWYSKNLIAYSLWPFALSYQGFTGLRRLLYRLKIKKTVHFSVPIIVVGNLTVGGTGKTPLVIWLVNFLQSQGYRPGVVSRGYGGKAKVYPQLVTMESDPSLVGDEPLLIARSAACPVVVDPKRPRAVRVLLDSSDCDVVISDDGLQHLAMGRNLEIVVIDGVRRFGNGFCLPAGPLRESVRRLKSVTFVVNNGRSQAHEISMQLQGQEFKKINKPAIAVQADYFAGKSIHAVAAIGNPLRFFAALRAQGLKITEHTFADHYVYGPKDFEFAADEIIIMTEKDAVKCEKFADDRFWYLPVTAKLPVSFGKQLLQALKRGC